VVSVAFGVIALAVAWVAGFVFIGLQGATALAAIFVLVVVATLFGPWRIARAVRSHPLLILAVAVAMPLVVLFLSSPTYITAAR
jgi:hypothetical protein